MPRKTLALPVALQRPSLTPLDEMAAWSLDDAARATSLSRRLIQSLVASGEIPHGRIGRRLIFDPPTIRRWVAARCGATQSTEAADGSAV